MAKYFVKMDDLGDQGKDLATYAKEQLDTKIDELINLGDALNWTGPVYEEYTNLYKERTSKLKYASKMIETYGNFMSMASDGFNNVNNEVGKKLDNSLTMVETIEEEGTTI